MTAVLNPATEETIAEIASASVDETDAAVARAKEAFPAWRAVARLVRQASSARVADSRAHASTPTHSQPRHTARVSDRSRPVTITSG